MARWWFQCDARNVAAQRECIYHRGSCYFANEMRDDLNDTSEDVAHVSLRGLEAYGPFVRLPIIDGVNRFSFAAKQADRQENVPRAVVAAFAQAAMEASVAGESRAVIVSLACDFVADACAGERIEAHIKVVRRTHSLIFLTADLTVGERILLTASGLAKCN